MMRFRVVFESGRVRYLRARSEQHARVQASLIASALGLSLARAIESAITREQGS